jgi:hypothetical protein
VAARFCPQCGAANSPSAVFCQYCGTALPPDPSFPLPSSGVPLGQPPPSIWGALPPGSPGFGGPPNAGPPYGTSAPPRPRRRLWVWIIVGLVVFILVVGVVGYLAIPPTAAINVTGITVQSSDNVCGLDDSQWNGFTADANEELDVGFNVTGATNSSGGTSSCTISSVNAVTAGFLVYNASVPLVVPANANETLAFDLNCPSSFNGILYLSFT